MLRKYATTGLTLLDRHRKDAERRDLRGGGRVTRRKKNGSKRQAGLGCLREVIVFWRNRYPVEKGYILF